MKKQEELQKWLDDDRYVQTKELAELWELTYAGAYAFLSKSSIKPTKKPKLASGGRAFLYDRAECEAARPFDKGEGRKEELQMYLNDNGYVQAKELAELWGISRSSVAAVLREHNIKPVKKLYFGRKGIVFFYDRAECERARPFINQPEKKEVEKVENIEELATMKDLMKFTGKSRYMIMKRFINKGITPISKPLIGKTVSYVYDLQQSLTVLSDILKPQYRKLIASETKEIKTMKKKQMNPPESKQQTPDVIPADTIDSYTLKQLESELQNRGVEFTPVTAEIIKGSDMPEFKQIAKMLDGEADSIILSGVKLGEVASFLEKSECVASILQKTEKPKVIPVDFFSINGDAGVFYLNKELKSCPFCGSDSVEVSCEKPTPVYWVAKIYCNGCEITTDNDGGTMESAAEVLIDFWNRRVSSESSVELQKTSGIDSTAIKSQISRIEQELISLKNMLS